MNKLEIIYEENEDLPKVCTPSTTDGDPYHDPKTAEFKHIIKRKNYEIAVLERKVGELEFLLEQKDNQIISMVDMGQEFKRLLQMKNVGTQVYFSEHEYIQELEQDVVQSQNEVNSMRKEMLM